MWLEHVMRMAKISRPSTSAIMNRYISEALRRLVSMRAEHLCEHCLIDIADTFLGGEVDHIVSVKHGGATEAR